MDISKLIKGWKSFVSKMNDKGIPLPMVRNPNTLEGDVALTLVVMSSALLMVGIVGKWGGWLGGIDMQTAKEFFYASCTLFFGHSWVHKKAGAADLEAPEGSDQKADDPDAK